MFSMKKKTYSYKGLNCTPRALKVIYVCIRQLVNDYYYGISCSFEVVFARLDWNQTQRLGPRQKSFRSSESSNHNPHYQ